MDGRGFDAPAGRLAQRRPARCFLTQAGGMFPNFRWPDLTVAAVTIVILHPFEQWGQPDVVRRGGIAAVLCLLVYAVWSWRRRDR